MSNWLEQTTSWYNENARQFAKGVAACDTSNDLQNFAAQVTPGGTILDIGCGTGRDLAWLKDKGFQTFGIEPSAEMRKLCVEKNLDVSDTPMELFTDIAKWNGIWCMGVFVHIPLSNWLDSFLRIGRALKPNGVAVIFLKEGIGETIDGQGRVLARMTRSDLDALLKQTRLRYTIKPHIAPTSAGTPTSWLEITLTC